jgi:ABC-type Fe3+/spermidine/putrescine transport system ATPase subunit
MSSAIRAAVVLDDVRCHFGSVRAVDGVSLSIAQGEFFTLLGPSGSGKTTCLRMIGGFVLPTSGRVLIGGADMTMQPPYARPVNTVFQDYALFPHMNVRDNVAYSLMLRKQPRRERERRAEELLALVRLPGVGDRRPAELSGGQQQRVALARALAPDPSLVLLDEPFSALDAALRESVRSQVREALERSHATALVVTHDQDEALSVADSVAVLDDGRIQMHDSPQAVYRSPSGLGVARFVGQCVELPASVAGGVAVTALGRMPVDVVLPGSGVSHGVVVLRPEQLRLLPLTTGEGTAGEVVGGEYFGHDALVRVRIGGDDRPVEVQVRTLGEIPERGAVRVGVSGPARFYPA